MRTDNDDDGFDDDDETIQLNMCFMFSGYLQFLKFSFSQKQLYPYSKTRNSRTEDALEPVDVESFQTIALIGNA